MHSRSAALRTIGFATIGISLLAPAALGEGPEWTIMGRYEGVVFGTRISAMASWDDGTGTSLYLGGDFSLVGSALGSGVVRFDGDRFHAVGCGIVGLDPFGASDISGNVSYYGEVETIEPWDPDAAGPLSSVLVVGGRFGHAGGQTVNNIAVWDGSQWSTLGSGLGQDTGLALDYIYSRVHDFQVFNGELYACGVFQLPNGQNLAKWNGASWTAVGSNLPGWPQGMTVHDDGTGAALYVCGRGFGGVYKLDGGSWVNIAGAAGTPADPNSAPDDYGAIVSFDPDGAGPQSAMLCVAGQSNGVELRLWTWAGGAWTSHSFAEVTDPNTQAAYNRITGMTVHDDGSGPALFMTVGSVEIGPSGFDRGYSFLHKWDGSTFSVVGTPTTIAAGETIPGGAGSLPIVSTVGGEPAVWFAPHFDGILKQYASGEVRPSVEEWGENVFISDTALLDPDGNGPADPIMYCVGDLQSGIIAATFDGDGFEALPALPLPPDFTIHHMAGTPQCVVFDDGTGNALYVSLTEEAGTSVYKLVGSAWESVGGAGAFHSFHSGVGLRSDRINDLAVFDDGSGSKLYATGRFTTVNGVLCNHIARWSGTAWEPVGPTSPHVGLRFGFAYEELGLDLVVHDDGSGRALYVGGRHDGAGSVNSPRVVRWNGTSWQAVGSFFTPTMPASRLVVHASEAGTELFAGEFDGLFGAEGDIVRWDGTSWISASGGLNFGQDTVTLLGSLNNGCDHALYAVGSHIEDYIADSLFSSLFGYWLYRWDGTGWSRVPDTFSIGTAPDYAFDFDLPNNRGILISGNYGGVGGSATNCGTASMIPSAFTAIWGCPLPPPPPCPADWDDDGEVTVPDIFAFLSSWFGGDADFNEDGQTTVPDIFAYLIAWFAGCD